MTIKVMVQDSIQSDLFEVAFNDNLVSALQNIVTVEPIITFIDGEYKETGYRRVMKHTDLIKLINETAY